MSSYQHIIFDLDGTLVDSAPAILQSFGTAFAESGITPARAIAETMIGPPLTETLQALSGSHEPALIARLADAFKACYDTAAYKATTAYEGIDTLLADLVADGLSLSIATNKRIHPTRLLLEHLGWDSHFTHVYALDLFSPRLPDKATMIGRLLQDQSIPRDSAIYIGDRSEDGESADANGLPFIAVTWGYGSLDETEMRAGWQGVPSTDGLRRLLIDGRSKS
jgi:phosphoglycolate phosphatase